MSEMNFLSFFYLQLWGDECNYYSSMCGILCMVYYSLHNVLTLQVFYLPPVGTQGFRSPEGSQLVVASHSDVIVPHLTQRSDVWSMGILMLRLFLGEDGPSTQRHVSFLWVAAFNQSYTGYYNWILQLYK